MQPPFDPAGFDVYISLGYGGSDQDFVPEDMRHIKVVYSEEDGFVYRFDNPGYTYVSIKAARVTDKGVQIRYGPIKYRRKRISGDFTLPVRDKAIGPSSQWTAEF